MKLLRKIIDTPDKKCINCIYFDYIGHKCTINYSKKNLNDNCKERFRLKRSLGGDTILYKYYGFKNNFFYKIFSFTFRKYLWKSKLYRHYKLYSIKKNKN